MMIRDDTDTMYNIILCWSLGHGWEGTCNMDYSLPEEYTLDYGVPSNNCSESSAQSGVFIREVGLDIGRLLYCA